MSRFGGKWKISVRRAWPAPPATLLRGATRLVQALLNGRNAAHNVNGAIRWQSSGRFCVKGCARVGADASEESANVCGCFDDRALNHDGKPLRIGLLSRIFPKARNG